MPKAKFNREQKDFVCYHLSLTPPTSSTAIGQKFAEFFPEAEIEVGEPDCSNLKRRTASKKRIQEIRDDPKLQFNLSRKFEPIDNVNYLNQLKLLDSIAKKTSEGYNETVGSASGEAVEVERYDFRTTIYSLREIRRIMDELGLSAGEDLRGFTVTVKAVAPADIDDDDSGDEDPDLSDEPEADDEPL